MSAARARSSDVQKEFARLAQTLSKLDRKGTRSRRERGLQKMTETVGAQGGRVMNDLVMHSPDLARFIVDFAYGDVIARSNLDDRTRALIVVAALAALGNAQPQLQVHIGSALNSGCTEQEIIELMLIVSVYAGFPAALNGIAAARNAIGSGPGCRRSPKRLRRN